MDVPVGTVSIDLSDSWDGLYWSFLVATVLSGITIVQAWIYINNCEMDPWGLRILVIGLILGDLTTTGLDLHVLHFSLVENFGNLKPLGDITKTAASEFLLTMVIVYIVQIFFASRVYLFTRDQLWLPAGIMIFGTGAFVTGTMAAADMFKHPVMAFLTTRQNEILFGINGGFAAIADIGITVSLTWTLASAKRGVKRTDTMLQKLLLYIVSRGLLVSVTQVLFLVVFLTGPGSVHWAPFHFMASKLYVITMVALLNGRHNLRDQQGGNVFSTSSLFTDSRAVREPPPTHILVHKTVELTRFRDDLSNNCQTRAKSDQPRKDHDVQFPEDDKMPRAI
ncbi:hypothetical protein BV22DRAFT_921130 [Leucogyrophana mollusca]|uniref:Uncharacterized protein n=1 Tax=Leucogyrophana mollusca TaxID=85980 RepID=A0ACB8AY73_9AGAM|nr:hypothetical protein BV22DRAFT_921130 [Leucogyrophana mollusca]